MPAQGGLSPTGPQFAQQQTEVVRLCADSTSELDFKMIENAHRNIVKAFNLMLPYSGNLAAYQ